VFFGIGNFAGASYYVLGPLIAKQSLGGVAAWATIVSALGVGTIIGGLIALRIRPRRPLLASCLAAIPYSIPMLAIALELPVPILVGVSTIAGVGIAIHLALWFTVFQQQVPGLPGHESAPTTRSDPSSCSRSVRQRPDRSHR
jgi:hypothetical protein